MICIKNGSRKGALLAGSALWVLMTASMTLAQHDFMPPPSAPTTVMPPPVYSPPAPPAVARPKAPAPKPATSVQTTRPTVSKPKIQAAQPAVPRPESPERISLRGLQEALTQAGFDPGPVDGLIGSRTRGAVSDWIDSIENADHANQAREAMEADDYIALAAMVGGEGFSPVIAAQPQLAAATASSGASTAPAGSGVNGGGAPEDESDRVSKRFPPQLEPDAEVLRILAEIDAPGDEFSIEGMTAELTQEEITPDDADIEAVFLAERRAISMQGVDDSNSFMKRKEELIRQRDFMTWKLSIRDPLYLLQVQRENYETALANEQVLVNNSYSVANAAINKSVRYQEETIVTATDEWIPYALGRLTYVVSNGFSESTINYWRNRVESNYAMIERIRKDTIPHLLSQEVFNNQLYMATIDSRNASMIYAGTSYSFGRSPTFTREGVLIGRDSNNLKQSIANLYLKLKNQRAMVDDWKQAVQALQMDIADFRQQMPVSDKVDEELSDLKDDLADVLPDPIPDLDPEPIPDPSPDADPEPDAGPSPGPDPEPSPDPNPSPDPDAEPDPDADTGGGDPDPEPEIDADDYFSEATDPDVDNSEAVARKQQEIDQHLQGADRARAELESIRNRDDVSAEQKQSIVADLNARIRALETFARNEQATLESLGGTYDGTVREDLSNFDPYALNDTDRELARIAEKQKATDRYYEEIKRAREAIRETTDGLDAVNLHKHVTDLSERITDNADEINKLAEDLHNYRTNIVVTRKQGDLEYMAAMAESAMRDAEGNVDLLQDVIDSSKNANMLLLLGASGGAALGIGGITVAEAAAAQAVMAGFEGATGAIEGFNDKGVLFGLAKGTTDAAKYYAPINTLMAAADDKSTKTDVALGVLSDAAMLFGINKTVQANLDKATAAQAAITRQALTPAEQAISKAAKQAADKADDLIVGYQKAKWTAQQARATGMVDDVAETTLQRAIKAIDRSDEAKLALKARDPKLQYQFVQDQAAAIKAPVKAAFEQNMRAKGWSADAVEMAQAQSAPSAGPVSAADKAKFQQAFTREGKPGTLPQWEADARAAMDQAYMDKLGYSAFESRVAVTNPVTPEAGVDAVGLMGAIGNVTWADQTDAGRQIQIGEAAKAATAMGLGGGGTNTLSGDALERAVTQTKAASRELMADLATKAQGAPTDVTLPETVQKQLRILDGLSRGIHDPAVANRLLLEQTGTSLAQTLETLGPQVEGLLSPN
ncbi:hypothetical protein OO012_15140 [Rhodobacteraceae bacterium KMM 6894]|nr:hypothetical protein [Rhodobacteraceae bacterium KMM 6894]